MPDGMPIPLRIRIGGMAAAVEINLMEAGAFVVRNINQKILALDELPERTIAQRAGWQTTRLMAVLVVALLTLLLNGQRGGQKLGLARVHGARLPPDAGEIGLTIVGARRGAGGWSVPLHVGSDPKPIFTQRVELRGVAQANVERRDLRCFDRNALLLERPETRDGGRDVVGASRQVGESVFARGRSGGLENGAGLRVLGLDYVVVDWVADGIGESAANGTGGCRALRQGGEGGEDEAEDD